MNALERIEKLFRVSGLPGPEFERTQYVRLYATVLFEPWGRASECWERVYVVELPTVQYHWKNNRGEWVPGKEGLCMAFQGHTFREALEKAATTLEEVLPLLSVLPSKQLKP